MEIVTPTSQTLKNSCKNYVRNVFIIYVLFSLSLSFYYCFFCNLWDME